VDFVNGFIVGGTITGGLVVGFLLKDEVKWVIHLAMEIFEDEKRREKDCPVCRERNKK